MMPKKAKQRQPDEPVLATFMISYEKWQDFQKAARAEGTTASATLVAFIESYLAEERLSASEVEITLEAQLNESLDARIEEAVALKVAGLDKVIGNHLQNAVKERDATLDARIEEAVGLKIIGLGEMLNHLQNTITEIDKRLGKVETSTNQLNTGKYPAPKLIDVKAVSVDQNIDQNLEMDIDTDKYRSQDIETVVDKAIDNLAGLTQKDLCEEFGINPSSIVRNARMRGLSSSEYLHQLTGWVHRNGKYYPSGI